MKRTITVGKVAMDILNEYDETSVDVSSCDILDSIGKRLAENGIDKYKKMHPLDRHDALLGCINSSKLFGKYYIRAHDDMGRARLIRVLELKKEYRNGKTNSNHKEIYKVDINKEKLSDIMIKFRKEFILQHPTNVEQEQLSERILENIKEYFFDIFNIFFDVDVTMFEVFPNGCVVFRKNMGSKYIEVHFGETSWSLFIAIKQSASMNVVVDRSNDFTKIISTIETYMQSHKNQEDI